MRIKTKHHLFLSVFLCTALVFSIVPVSAMAASEPPAVTAIAQFDNVELDGYKQQIKLNWGVVSGVNGYELYCADSNNNQPVLLADIPSVLPTSLTYTYKDPTLQYTFTLKSYIIFNGDKYYSDAATYNITPYMRAGTLMTKVLKVKYPDGFFDYADFIYWDCLPGVSGYELEACYRMGYERPIKIEGTNVGFYLKNTDYPYLYRVRPYYIIDGNTVYGPYSNEVNGGFPEGI